MEKEKGKRNETEQLYRPLGRGSVKGEEAAGVEEGEPVEEEEMEEEEEEEVAEEERISVVFRC